MTAAGRRWLAPAVMLVAAGLLALYVARNVRVTTNVAHLLTSLEDRDRATLIGALSESELARTLIVSLGAADADQAAAAGAAFARRIATHPEVAWIERGPEPGIEEAVHALYHPRRLMFASPDPERDLVLDDPALARHAERLLAELGGPTAPLVKRLAPGDPLMFFAAILRRFEAARPGDLVLRGDQLLTRDERHAIVFIGTRHGPLDADSQGPFLAALDAAAAEVARELGHDVELELAGIHPFGVQARASIERDIARISIISLIAIVILFLWLYRSLVLLLVATLPLAFGLLAGLALGIAVYGEIHGLTLAFAATLIGVCIDYAIHLFTEHTLGPAGRSAYTSVRHIAPGLWLSAVTTLVGFAALAASTLPGLGEIGVVSFGGVFAALLVTRYAMPALMPDAKGPRPHAERLVTKVDGLLGALARRRGLLYTIVGVAVVVGLAAIPLARWSDDLSALNARDPTLLAEDTAVRARVSDVEPGRVIAAVADTEEEALQINDRIASRLAPLVADGRLGGFRSAHAFLWSQDLQAKNALAIARADLGRRLPPVLAAAGFRPGVFAPFDKLLSEPAPPPLTWRMLQDSPLHGLIRAFRIEVGSRVGLVTFLQGAHGPAAGAALEAALADVPGALYVDQRAFMNRAYGTFRDRAGLAIAFGVLAIVLLVALRYRRAGATLAASLPAVAACGLTLAILSIAGVELDLLHLVSLLLVFEMGVDYGVFMLEANRRDGGVGVTLVGLLFACATTVLGFGLLALSDQPAMRSIGLTLGIGIVATIVLVPCVLLLVDRRARARARTP